MSLQHARAWLQHHALKLVPVAVACISFAMGGDWPAAAQASQAPSTGAAAQLAATQGVSSTPPAVPTPRSKGEDIVFLNVATQSDLTALPGIGAKRAQAILDLRDKRGGKFKSVDEIVRVRGIGSKMLARLRPRLGLTPPEAPQDVAKTAMATKSSTK